MFPAHAGMCVLTCPQLGPPSPMVPPLCWRWMSPPPRGLSCRLISHKKGAPSEMLWMESQTGTAKQGMHNTIQGLSLSKRPPFRSLGCKPMAFPFPGSHPPLMYLLFQRPPNTDRNVCDFCLPPGAPKLGQNTAVFPQ